MFENLQPLQFRQPPVVDYAVPAVDVLNDTSSGVLVVPPGAPALVGITTAGLVWMTEPSATEYLVEALLSGTQWTQVTTVTALPKVQVFWNGTVWYISVLTIAGWAVLYQSITEPTVGSFATPNLVTEWVMVGYDSPAPTLDMSGTVASAAMTISNAGDARVNAEYSTTGPFNGRPLYAGPLTTGYAFTPTGGVFYRVRGVNSAGNGPSSDTALFTVTI